MAHEINFEISLQIMLLPILIAPLENHEVFTASVKCDLKLTHSSCVLLN